jgi:hypothetical protein
MDEISIRFNKKEKYAVLIINNITYITDSVAVYPHERGKGVHIQRDINNQISTEINNNALTVEFITDFIKQKSKEFYKAKLDKVIN